MAGVYFQKDMDFINSKELDTEINLANNISIDAIEEFISGTNLSNYGLK